MVRKQNTVPFLKRYWVSSIGVFLLSQIFFMISEATGRKINYRDTDGTLLGKILNTPIFAEWFNFYETPQYNLLTVFFCIFFLFPGIISAIKNGFPRYI
ncbi:YfzA family protein [Paenibacillus sp. alder61]|uniref:YfzA family protein n=1 Tax=Paenibacillus sp. alder61 TaxID=2862948 RepID=UPI001CD44728|nr:YfzA family protein [Paenibacillus sp. alder61]MCA1295165.1 YfzA family protein [Paenibacillus sp. alder61]